MCRKRASFRNDAKSERQTTYEVCCLWRKSEESHLSRLFHIERGRLVQRRLFLNRQNQTGVGSQKRGVDPNKNGGQEMKIRPLHDKVLIKRINEEERTKGGIIIPDTAKEKPMEGEIVAVGQGKRLEDGKLSAMSV